MGLLNLLGANVALVQRRRPAVRRHYSVLQHRVMLVRLFIGHSVSYFNVATVANYSVSEPN